MQNIRRWYLYSVSLISLEVVLWGVIGLLRSVFTQGRVGGGAEQLAWALSLVLVGIPVFGLHWFWAQRAAQNDFDERSSTVRALFLYLFLVITCVPALQNALAVLNRAWLVIFDLPATGAIFGGDQTWSDNLVALAVNLGAAAYFSRVLQSAWQSDFRAEHFITIRRWYRYFWLLYGLVLAGAGIQQTLQFLLSVWSQVGNAAEIQLANGLSLMMVGVPLWYISERLLQHIRQDPVEQFATLRLVVNYAILFISIISLLVAGVELLTRVLQVVLGSRVQPAIFFGQISVAFSIAVTMALIWAYYSRSFKRELLGTSGSDIEESLPSTEWTLQGLRRLYYYGLALIGLTTAFIGLQVLVGVMLDLAFGEVALARLALRARLAESLAALLLGLPLWIVAWRTVTLETQQAGKVGEIARQAMVRRVYLYLVLFAAVVGAMLSAGALLYQIIRILLGDPPARPLFDVMAQLKTFLLFVALLSYHWVVLRADNRLMQATLARRRAQFPVLVLAPEDDQVMHLIGEIMLQQIPGLPVAVHLISQGVPDPSFSTAKAVILPAELAVQPGEAYRLWLANYDGRRMILPTPIEGWTWLSGARRTPIAMARQTAKLVRKLADGDERE